MTLKDELFAGIKAKRDVKNSTTQQMAGRERGHFTGSKPGRLTVSFVQPMTEQRKGPGMPPRLKSPNQGTIR